MDPFPQDWELISLFEVEPNLLEPRLPWQYNRLTFETVRGDNRIQCMIEPAYHRFEFMWWHNQSKHLALDLHWVSGLTIVTGSGIDYLIATFMDDHLAQLRLQLKPTIECQWGTTRQFP